MIKNNSEHKGCGDNERPDFWNKESSDPRMKTIYLAGGCFWGVQKFFDQFDGVISTEVGYANGPEETPTYQDVCQSSGHAETVKVVYDENRITLTEDVIN